MKRQIGYGIVGTGSVADFHAWAIAQVDGAKLHAVCSRDVTKARAFAAKHQVAADADLRSLLSRSEIDVICVTTPSGAHEEPALAAFAAGKHVLCEKPLEISTARVDRMLSAAQQHRRWLGAVLPARFGDGAQTLKRAIEQGRFGRLTLCSAYVKWWRTQEYYQASTWRGTWELDGGGALMNQGIHAVDLLLWLAGMPCDVSAFSATLAHDIKVEDTLSAALRFENGALGAIECATSCAPGEPRRVEICGSQGSATIQDDRITRWEFAEKLSGDDLIVAGKNSASSGSGGTDPRAIGTEGHRRVIADMTAAVRDGRSPYVAGDEGRKAVAVIEAIYASAARQTKISR